jgi:hypothetical protein
MNRNLYGDDDEALQARADRAAAHGLVAAAKAAQLPGLYSTDGQGNDAIARLKFFTPWSNWTWYVLEFDGDDECFGLVQGHQEELGSFSLAELEAIRGRWGLRVERDLHFEPQPLSKVRHT